MKSRKKKLEEYNEKYKDIPRDYNQRLEYLYHKEKINDKITAEIVNKMNTMISNMYYRSYRVILYEDPEGSPRPRSRLVNRTNIIAGAKVNTSFIQVYSITGKSDNMYMKRLMNEELDELESIIYTPCDVIYSTYSKTPSYYNRIDKILCEIGLIRPLTKPDWDNMGKKYSDMYNGNVWIDDTCVVDGTVRKYYSILPRIEIDLLYLNALYNKKQCDALIKRANLHDIDKIYYFGSDGNECFDTCKL